MSLELARSWPGPEVPSPADGTGPAFRSPDFDLDIPPELAPQPFTARLYRMLAPLAQFDPFNAWSLLVYLNAAARPYELVEAWVRDTEQGPGWSLLLDVDRCPPEALPWLAQLVGVRLIPGASADDSRARIRAVGGFHRGTRQAIYAAAKQTLTGAQNVFITERAATPEGPPVWGAYYLDVMTYANETPSQFETLQAILSQKPAGLVLNYRVQTGQSYRQVRDRFATYQDVRDTYPTYEDMRDDQPPAPGF
jgi:hypothetical protein